MINKVTSFTHHVTAEGDRIVFTYSQINENGKVVVSNERETVIVLDDKIKEAIQTIYGFINGKLPN